ncbi:MAG TPA: MOSC domain-containing protein [Caulobacteraceae bacterium]|jgi:MOSC domain-containing protein YiiM|nr:MOSC domain-containing protein [Caulobacteraceae bacterium]
MGEVIAVARSEDHRFSKQVVDEIRLIAGVGVEGDCHGGASVQHRSRVARDPTQPNLRQVHLVHEELFAELRAQGFEIEPGAIGENVTTRALDLLALPQATRLRLGDEAVVELTGLRNPCLQLDRYRSGLMQAVLERTPDGALIRKAGVMAIVLKGGAVRPGDRIEVELPTGKPKPLTPI